MHATDRAFIARTTARMLLEVKAVLFSAEKPFIFTSGWASPVYIDCRKLIFYPRIRSQLCEFAVSTLARRQTPTALSRSFELFVASASAGVVSTVRVLGSCWGECAGANYKQQH